MHYSDSHSHMIYGVDDGARDRQTSIQMLDFEYKDGVRLVVLTPHCHPGYYGDHHQEIEEIFRDLEKVGKERWPDMTLVLGNELHYDQNCLSWVRDGICRTLGGTRYLLVDFSDSEDAGTIESGLGQLLSGGLVPVLAHAERYRDLWHHKDLYQRFQDRGVLLQMDTQSVLGGFGWGTRHMAGHLLKAGMYDFVGTDAHNMTVRPPGMSKAYQYVSGHYGNKYADRIFSTNLRQILLEERGSIHVF